MYPSGKIEDKENNKEVIFYKDELIKVQDRITLEKRNSRAFKDVGFCLDLNIYDENGYIIPVKKWDIIVDDAGVATLVPTAKKE